MNLNSQAVFTNLNKNNQQIFLGVDSLQNGIYRVSYKFYQEGTYTLKIYFNNLLIYNNPTSNYTVMSDLCKDTTGTGQLLFKCPNNPSICANSYQECPYINLTMCPNVLSPFLCGAGSSSGSNKCVSNMANECCKINDRPVAGFLWCPHLNQCFNYLTAPSTCPSILPSPTPYYCQSK